MADGVICQQPCPASLVCGFEFDRDEIAGVIDEVMLLPGWDQQHAVLRQGADGAIQDRLAAHSGDDLTLPEGVLVGLRAVGLGHPAMLAEQHPTADGRLVTFFSDM